MKRIILPLSKSVRTKLKIGEKVFLCGTIYTARDAAHKRLVDLIKKKQKLPIDLKNSIIYYAGPTPPPPRKIIGSCGPNTSSRMDPFTLPLLKKGLIAMIGKGTRSTDIQKAIKRFSAVYFVALGGAGALLSKKIKKSEILCFRELGPEAIYKLEVEDFPVIVGIDSSGRNIYERRRKKQ